jgi:hypothetical protein
LIAERIFDEPHEPFRNGQEAFASENRRLWLSIYMIDRVLDGCIGLVCLVVLLFFPKGVDEINVSFCVYLQGGSVMLD